MTLPNQHTTVVVLPGATRAFNQQNSPHSTTDAASRPHEETRPPLYLLRHGIHSLCASPPKLLMGKYQERLTEIRREDPPSTTSIIANNTSLVKTLRGIGLPTAWLILETATIHVLWLMGPTGAYSRQPESSSCTWASQLSSAKYSLQPQPKIKPYHQLRASLATAKRLVSPSLCRKRIPTIFTSPLLPGLLSPTGSAPSLQTAQESQPKSVYCSS